MIEQHLDSTCLGKVCDRRAQVLFNNDAQGQRDSIDTRRDEIDPATENY